MIVEIIEHTPIWVFPLILFVLLLAGRNLRRRIVSVPRLFILPVVLLLLSIGNVAGAQLPPSLAFSAWCAAVLVGALIGWALARPPLRIDRAAARIELAGSPIPLLVCIGIVGLRYYFGYLFGRYPELQDNVDDVLILIAGSAWLGGITLGRYGRLGWWYLKAVRGFPAVGVEPSS